jgi:hypothetical protein
LSFNQNFLGGDDFNGTLLNLCLNLKSLEETGLFWIKTGWSFWYDNTPW